MTARTTTKRKRGAPTNGRPYSGPSIALRLPEPHMSETKRLAEQEASTPANFARRVYLLGLDQYRKTQQAQGQAVQA